MSVTIYFEAIISIERLKNESTLIVYEDERQGIRFFDKDKTSVGWPNYKINGEATDTFTDISFYGGNDPAPICNEIMKLYDCNCKSWNRMIEEWYEKQEEIEEEARMQEHELTEIKDLCKEESNEKIQ